MSSIHPPHKLSPIHPYHLTHRAALDHDAGWLVPARYTSPNDEVSRVREGVGVIDRSPVGKLDIKGADLRRWAVHAFGEDVMGSPGHVSRVRVNGGSSMNGLCCRLRDDWAFVITPAGQVEATLRALARHGDGCVHFTDVTSTFAALQLVGPQSRTVLEKLTALDLRPFRFPDLACAQGSVAKVHGLVLRSDLAGLPAYWLFISREYGEFVWETVFHAGEEYGVIPFGYEAYGQIHTT